MLARIFFALERGLDPGIALQFGIGRLSISVSWHKWMESLTGVDGADDWMVAHCFLCNMGAVKKRRPQKHRPDVARPEAQLRLHLCGPPNCGAFTVDCVRSHIQRHNRLPFEVSAAQMKEWNKSNTLMFIFAILRTTWMAIQWLVRSIKGIELCLLKLVTLAYTPLAFATFIL
jgi:hypothetical protein